MLTGLLWAERSAGEAKLRITTTSARRKNSLEIRKASLSQTGTSGSLRKVYELPCTGSNADGGGVYNRQNGPFLQEEPYEHMKNELEVEFQLAEVGS